MDKIFDLMDELPELVYACDIENYDLLYINIEGRRRFGLEGAVKKKCYQALQGRDTPCPFCTNALLKHDAFYTWEFTNPIADGHFLLKDKLITVDGRDVRIEIAFDMTEKEREKEELRNTLEAEKKLVECVRLLNSTSDVERTLAAIIEQIGNFLEAERSYIFEIRNGRMYNTVEWCAPEIAPVKDTLQDLDVHLIDRWQPSFSKRQCVVIEDLEQLRESDPEEYQALHQQGITRLIAAPMEVDGRLSGYIGVDNPPAGKLKNISSQLEALGYFIESSIRRQKDQRRLEHMSYYDDLTGAMNRNAFMRDIAQSKPGKRVGVVYLDVNGMKEINDEYGHLYGDRYLADVVKHIRKVFQKSRVYRVGGDEFIIVCTSLSEDLFSVRVRELKSMFTSSDRFSVSVGYQWSDGCEDLQKLLFTADEIMYMDKRDYYRGKNLARRYRHGNDDILGLTESGALRNMIESNRFLVYFQPKMSIHERTLIGAEALVRYLLPQGEIAPPDQFIPVLEEARLICQLDFYVFERVCAQLAEWSREGRAVVPVSVNFSRHSLSEKRFAEKLYQIWKKYDIPQENVVIEITESAEEDNHYDFLGVVDSIRKRGFAISIDDFGVRHANLSLFVSCDFDELKIDRSLIVDLESNPKARTIVQSVSDVCREMGVRLIVEGVETESQMEILDRMGCSGVQGFLFSRPVPGEEFRARYCALPGKPE